MLGIWKQSATVLAMMLLMACASPEIVEEPAREFAAEGLHPVKSSGFESAYVLPGAALAGYRVVAIDAMDFSQLEITQTAVSGTTRQAWKMTQERERTLNQAWQAATDMAFGDYEREGNAEDTLVIKALLTRVSPGRSQNVSAAASTVPLRGAGDTVDVSVEFKLYGADNELLLAVIRDQQTISALQWSRAAGVDMVNLFNSWAGLLHTRVSGR